MVSWDTYMLDPLAACDAFNRPEICSGDQSSSKSLQTVSRSVAFSVSSIGFGRLARFRNAFSASAALYRPAPPFLETSREMEDGALYPEP